MKSGHWIFLSLLLSFHSLFAASQKSRPNFLFICTDDQRWDALGVVQREQGDRGRFPFFQTPHLDRLAAEGVRFRNAFVTYSLCSPSRAALLTGRYNHQNGIINNRTPFPANAVTVASVLQGAGYKTAYFGKWHMGPQSGKRPGFDHSASFVGQGKYFDCPFEINGKSTPTKGWVDDVTTELALEHLKQPRSEPFLMMVGYKSSHGPWTPPIRLQEQYKENLPSPRPAVNATNLAPYKLKFSGDGPNPEARMRIAADGAEEGPKAQMIRNYFRTLAGVDENVGKILKALDELKLTESTMVIFTSDNGFYHGEHGLGDKRSAYDESLRVPLLVRYPPLGLKGKTIDALALNIDFAPTALDYAGAKTPKEMQGRSWRPLLEGKKEPWRTAFFYEYFYEKPFAIPTTLAVRTGSAKLIKYPGHDDWMELYDLKSDPYETKNLVESKAYQKLLDEMKTLFDREAAAVGFKMPVDADKVPGEK